MNREDDMKKVIMGGLILGIVLIAGCGGPEPMPEASRRKTVPYKEIERRTDKATGELNATVKEEANAY
jgi:hypothetical protein